VVADGAVVELQLSDDCPLVILQDHVEVHAAEARRVLLSAVGKEVLAAQQENRGRLALHGHLEAFHQLLDQQHHRPAVTTYCRAANHIDHARLRNDKAVVPVEKVVHVVVESLLVHPHRILQTRRQLQVILRKAHSLHELLHRCFEDGEKVLDRRID